MVDRSCKNRIQKQNNECFQVYCNTDFDIDQDDRLAEIRSPNIHDCIRKCSTTADCGYASWTAAGNSDLNTCYLFKKAEKKPYQTNFSDSAKLVGCPS